MLKLICYLEGNFHWKSFSLENMEMKMVLLGTSWMVPSTIYISDKWNVWIKFWRSEARDFCWSFSESQIKKKNIIRKENIHFIVRVKMIDFTVSTISPVWTASCVNSIVLWDLNFAELELWNCWLSSTSTSYYG